MNQGLRARANGVMAQMARALWSESEPRMDRDWVEWVWEWVVVGAVIAGVWVVLQVCRAVGL